GGGGPCGSAPAKRAWVRPATKGTEKRTTTSSAERRRRMCEGSSVCQGMTPKVIVDDDSLPHNWDIPDCSGVGEAHCMAARPGPAIFVSVGKAGFEPATSASRTLRANQAAPLPGGLRSEC